MPHVTVLCTLNISSKVSFLTSNLSKACFSLMIFLHKVSKEEKSLLDTPLEEKKVYNYFHCSLLTPQGVGGIFLLNTSRGLI